MIVEKFEESNNKMNRTSLALLKRDILTRIKNDEQLKINDCAAKCTGIVITCFDTFEESLKHRMINVEREQHIEEQPESEPVEKNHMTLERHVDLNENDDIEQSNRSNSQIESADKDPELEEMNLNVVTDSMENVSPTQHANFEDFESDDCHPKVKINQTVDARDPKTSQLASILLSGRKTGNVIKLENQNVNNKCTTPAGEKITTDRSTMTKDVPRKSTRTPRKRKHIIKTEFDIKRRRRMGVDMSDSNDDLGDFKVSPMLDEKPLVIKLEKVQKKKKSVLHRRKTIAPAKNLNGVASVDPKPSRKNTDKNMHCKVESHLCALCNEHGRARYSVLHYLKKHPDHEVFTARPSPKMADRLRFHIEKYTVTDNKIGGFCFFCEENKNCKRTDWARHFMTHTGESIFACTACDFRSKKKDSHDECPADGEMVNIYDANSSDGSMMAFMCKKCNYLQVSLVQMVRHMIFEHGYPEAIQHEHFEKIMLIPDLSPPKLDIKHKYADASEVFACTICRKRCQTADEFAAHFDEDHSEVEAYKCFCGEKMALDGCNLLGSFIVAHLLNHQADLFQCTICKCNFVERAHIQDHLCIDHAESEFKYQHIHRNGENSDTVTEVTMKKIKCTICKKWLLGATFAEAIEHFSSKHPTESVNIIAWTDEKTSRMGEKTSDIATTFSSGVFFQVTL